MIYDHRHQEQWEAIEAAIEGAAISVMVTVIWFLVAFLLVVHHYGR